MATQWQSVERVTNNYITRVVALLSIIGYLILFNDQIAEKASFWMISGVEPGTKNLLLERLIQDEASFLWQPTIAACNRTPEI
ncbi:hypothetical protein [Ruegeria arenilitoris]|uniref:hypothetical protein n=1 Tax=Ruegeria arenilitoris TaxID=1173585 RepID=UPI00147DE1C4|nr:hypothetical protein [Ruegeria arenilitoris]